MNNQKLLIKIAEEVIDKNKTKKRLGDTEYKFLNSLKYVPAGVVGAMLGSQAGTASVGAGAPRIGGSMIGAGVGGLGGLGLMYLLEKLAPQTNNALIDRMSGVMPVVVRGNSDVIA